jgi:hypothetical protein
MKLRMGVVDVRACSWSSLIPSNAKLTIIDPNGANVSGVGLSDSQSLAGTITTSSLGTRRCTF